MKLYIVIDYDSDFMEIKAVFSSQEEAEKFSDAHYGFGFQEHELTCIHLYEAYSPNGQIFSTMSIARCALCGYIPSDKENK